MNLRCTLAVARAHVCELSRRKLAIVLLVGLPVLFYYSSGDDPWLAVSFTTVMFGWAVAIIGLFSTHSVGAITPRLALAGFRAVDLVLGRLLGIAFYSLILGAALFAFVRTDDAVIDDGYLLLSFGFAFLGSAASGIAVGTLLRREMESMLILITVVSLTLVVSRDSLIAEWLPMHASERYAFASIDGELWPRDEPWKSTLIVVGLYATVAAVATFARVPSAPQSRYVPHMLDPAYVEAEEAFAHSVGLTEYGDQVVELPTLGCAVRVVEAGSGPPVLFVPGVNTTGIVFAELVAKMPNFHCIMIDRPGTGGSSLPTPPPTSHDALETFADAWLPELLDELGIDQAAMVSTSLGGWTAFRAAAAKPERFTKLFGFGFQIGARVERAPLVLRTPAPKPWMLPSRMRISRSILRRSLGWFGMKEVLANGRFGEPMLAWVQALFRYTGTYKNEVLHVPRLVDMRGPCEVTRHDHGLLAKVTPPVHLFWGTDDVWAGERSAQEFADALPNATLQLVQGAGHAPWLDEPDLAIEALLTHLGSEGEAWRR